VHDTTLKINKTTEKEDLDEIFIDIRGNIHRPGQEDEETSEAVTATDPTSNPDTPKTTTPSA